MKVTGKEILERLNEFVEIEDLFAEDIFEIEYDADEHVEVRDFFNDRVDIPERYRNCSFANLKNINIAYDMQVDEIKKNLDKSMIICGDVGTGKTHLAIAIVKDLPLVENKGPERLINTLVKQLIVYSTTKLTNTKIRELKKTVNFLYHRIFLYRSQNAIYIPSIDLFITITDRDERAPRITLLSRYLETDCLIIDDLGTERTSDATMQYLYYIVNSRYNKKKQTIITTNLSAKEIYRTMPRIFSRIAEDGLIIQLNTRDYRILKAGAKNGNN